MYKNGYRLINHEDPPHLDFDSLLIFKLHQVNQKNNLSPLCQQPTTPNTAKKYTKKTS